MSRQPSPLTRRQSPTECSGGTEIDYKRMSTAVASGVFRGLLWYAMLFAVIGIGLAALRLAA